MLETAASKQIIAARRERRDMTRDGWVHLGEDSHLIGSMVRGERWRQKIVDVRIAHDGMSLWVKLGDK